MRILVTGAAGSGTSTLARAAGAALAATVLEADDYFWLPTLPRFTSKRDPRERLSLLLRDVERSRRIVIAGSIVDWGEQIENSLSLIVFLTVPASIRVERLRRREEQLASRRAPIIRIDGDVHVSESVARVVAAVNHM